MARRIAVSFEDNIAKIAYASFSRGSLIIEKTISLKDEEFSDFLKGEKEDDFIVAADFVASYQEILTLPSVKEKYIRRIIEDTVRKSSPEIGEFSYVYTPIGEKILEGRKAGEYFVVAVGHDSLNRIIDRFNACGKRIRHLLSPVFALSRIIQMHSDFPASPVLCVTETGEKKNFLLIKNRKLYFYRTAQSFGSGILDFDVQNINMTINYCNQTLKIPPSHVFLIGSAGSRYEATAKLAIPSLCITYPPAIIAQRETIDGFLVPVSSLIHGKDIGKGDFLPRHYRDFYMQKSVLTYGTAAFLALSLAGAVYALKNLSHVRSANEEISSIRADIERMKAIPQNFEDRNAELQRFMPNINSFNAANTAPDFQGGLIAISRLRMKDAALSVIAATPAGDALALSIKGKISAESYDDAQERYRVFIEAIRKIPGISLTSDKIDPGSRDFQIEARYRGG